MTAAVAEQPPRCAPLAQLFTSVQALDEPTTRQQMRSLCLGCTGYTSCRAQALAMRAQSARERLQHAPQMLGGVVLGMTGGQHRVAP